MKISGVIFDFGGVMTASTDPIYVREAAQRHNLDWSAILRGFAEHRLDYDRGDISLAELYERIYHDANMAPSESVKAEMLRADSKSWCCRNERTLEWMRVLKQRGFKLGILTNMAPQFANEYFRKVFADYIALADALVISGEERIVKPDSRIYEIMQKRINLPSEELCFVDDVKINIEAAKRANWQAIQFLSNGQVEHDYEEMVKP